MALITKTEKTDEIVEPDPSEVLDLTGKSLRKLEKCADGRFGGLILDKNELTRLENVESYGDIKKLSAANNNLVRMYGVCRVINVEILNLANNSIVAIEGLRELIHLKWLNLSGNKIKTIEHLGSNIALEYLDLSHNCISSLINVSHLKNLHTLLLDYNDLKNLTNASNYLPPVLTVFSVAGNFISDLNQVSFLGNFQHLEQFSISHNPCVDMTGNVVGFDHRPFIINWCQNLKLLDGFVIGSKESLKAEWLYSMGKGRHFQVGEHAELIDYLAGVCPLTHADNLMTEEDAKLNHILNKQQQHQRQLMEEMASEHSDNRPSTAPVAINSCKPSNSSIISPGFDRVKSAASPRSNAFSSLLPSHQRSKMHSPTRHWTAFKSKKKSDVSEKYPVDLTTAQYELHSSQREFQDQNSDSFMSFFSEAPSDVPESTQEFSLDIDAPASVMPLKSETQYVPVPETMLSPDFRPITTSPHCNLFDTGIGSDAHASFSELETTNPRWLHRSSIPRVAGVHASSASFTSSPRHLSCRDSDTKPHHRSIRSSATDSPLLKRPTQVQKLQKSSRPVSLSPSCGRRSPTTPKKTVPNHPKNISSSSSDDSTDSDISLSKLSLVKEVAQTKLEAIVRKSLDSSMEERSSIMSSSDSLLQLSHSLAAKIKGKPLPGKVKKMGKVVMSPYCNDDVDDSQNKTLHKAATVIQAAWRGFRVRNFDSKTIDVRQEIRVRRAENHVHLLQQQLAKTQKELECEKRLRSLQMEAIRALWKEVQQLQVTDGSKVGREFITPPDSGIESPMVTSDTVASNSNKPEHSQRANSLSQNELSSVKTSTSVSEKLPDSMKNTATGSSALPLQPLDARPLASVPSKTEISLSHAVKQDTLLANTKMISHLIETCNCLQHQVHHFQEALQTVSRSMLTAEAERHTTGHEMTSQTVTQISSPFVSAVATPVTHESSASIVSTGNRMTENGSTTASLSDDDRLFSEKSSPDNVALSLQKATLFADNFDPLKEVAQGGEALKDVSGIDKGTQ